MERGSKQIIIYYDGPTDGEPMCLDKVEGEIHPPSPPAFTPYNYRDDLYEYTNTAIAHYNSNHQNDQFELVSPLCLRAFASGDFCGSEKHHLSFIARRKKSSELKLFFAAFRYPRRVKICSTVEPGNPLFQVGCGVCHPDGAIYHIFMKCGWGAVGGDHSGVLYSGGFRYLSTREASAGKFLREAYTIKSAVEDLDAEDAYELKQKINGHAMMALDTFNSQNGASYKFLEAVSCTRFVCEAVSWAGVFWAHLIFVAEAKDLIEPVFFFAEVGFDIVTVTCVVIPSTSSADSLSGNKIRCTVCPSDFEMFHPPGGYMAGYYRGAFADSLHNGKFRAVKAKLQQKDDEAGSAARNEFYKSLEN